NARTDGLIKTEQDARVQGNADTLADAKKHTDTTVAGSNARTDGLIKTEQDARVQGDANTLAEAKNYSNVNTSRALESANAYTDNKFQQLGEKINRAEKRLNAGIAGVTAMTSIPYVTGKRFSYGIGLGNYQNGNAAAAGIQLQATQNTNIRLNVSWDSSRNSSIGIGLAGSL
ncbi:YadA-like family protein, partial [Salmonella enterica]|nr:YadA-like family protein [Salmonella enterica]